MFEISTWVFGFIGAIAAIAFMEEWGRKKGYWGKENQNMTPIKTSGRWNDFLKKTHQAMPLIMALATILFIVSGLVWMHEVAKKTNFSGGIQSGSIPETNTNLDAIYEALSEKRDGGRLCEYGKNLFETNNFSYSKLFFERARDKYVDQNGGCTVDCDGYYQVACLAQNPTGEGWREFTNSLNLLVKNISEDIEKENRGEAGLTNSYYTHSGRLVTISKHLAMAKDKLADSQKAFVKEIEDKIDALIPKAPHQDQI